MSNVLVSSPPSRHSLNHTCLLQCMLLTRMLLVLPPRSRTLHLWWNFWVRVASSTHLVIMQNANKTPTTMATAAGTSSSGTFAPPQLWDFPPFFTYVHVCECVTFLCVHSTGCGCSHWRVLVCVQTASCGRHTRQAVGCMA